MGEIKYDLQYHPKILSHDLRKIDNKSRGIIQRAIESKLSISPEIYSESLKQDLRGLRKMRVGNYRIIFYIKSREIFIMIIAHRSSVYDAIRRCTR